MSKRIGGQFAPRLIEMLNSPAYRVLSRAAHQVLSRTEIELARHGGKDNGKLPVTFDQFVTYGLRRHAIAPAIRELVVLGFLEVTQQGRAGNAEWRRPSNYRLTYHRDSEGSPATNEWRQISEDDAMMIAKGARRPGSNSANMSTGNGAKKPAKKNRIPVSKTSPRSVSKTSPRLGDGKRTDGIKNAHNSIVRKPSLHLDSSPSTGEAQGPEQQQQQPSPSLALTAPATGNANTGNGAASPRPDPYDAGDIPEFLRRR